MKNVEDIDSNFEGHSIFSDDSLHLPIFSIKVGPFHSSGLMALKSQKSNLQVQKISTPSLFAFYIHELHKEWAWQLLALLMEFIYVPEQ